MSETVINIEKSPVLAELIKKLIIALDPLGIHDTSIKKYARILLKCLNNPNDCLAETLADSLDNLGAIVKSYNIKIQENNFANSIQAIPYMLYEARKEVEHLMTVKKINSKSAKHYDLLNNINNFYKASFVE